MFVGSASITEMYSMILRNLTGISPDYSNSYQALVLVLSCDMSKLILSVLSGIIAIKTTVGFIVRSDKRINGPHTWWVVNLTIPASVNFPTESTFIFTMRRESPLYGDRGWSLNTNDRWHFLVFTTSLEILCRYAFNGAWIRTTASGDFNYS